jgi:Na+-transporting NADH:ubiquinone oxidoreductase subunit NqrC
MNKSFYLSLILFFAAFACQQSQQQTDETSSDTDTTATEVQEEAPAAPKKPEYRPIAAALGVEIAEANAHLQEMVVNASGEALENVPDAADTKYWLAQWERESAYQLPVWKYEDATQTAYVFFFAGEGYGGAVWGYFALNENFDQLLGAAFDHEDETVGFGGDTIRDDEEFLQSFRGISLTDNGDFLDWKLRPLESTIQIGEQELDAVSGATVTMESICDMANEGMKRYQPFIRKMTGK